MVILCVSQCEIDTRPFSCPVATDWERRGGAFSRVWVQVSVTEMTNFSFLVSHDNFLSPFDPEPFSLHLYGGGAESGEAKSFS